MTARHDCAQALLRMTHREIMAMADCLDKKAQSWGFQGESRQVAEWLLEWADQQVSEESGGPEDGPAGEGE